VELSEDTDAERAKASEPQAAPSGGPVARSAERLPAPLPGGPPRRRWPRVALVLAVIALAGGGAWWWWAKAQDRIPAGIAWSNGRLEADDIDIATKLAGRIAEIDVQEGDMVKAGQVVARMDTRDLEASLRQAEAQVQRYRKAIDETLARQQLDRTAALVARGNATRELLDQRRQQLSAAMAALAAASARVAEAQHAFAAAQHDVEAIKVNIADNTLVAPRDGRIQYRVANVGEVIGAGGRVLTMIDVASVYMDIYLPTVEAGRARVGAEARIVLDAYPDIAIPAKVAFVATAAQFTPKTVETRSERDRLMFRVRVRVDPDLLRARADRVRSGLPGVAYVRLDPDVPWPARLQRLAGQ
jgi:HlyD family secretion protein